MAIVKDDNPWEKQKPSTGLIVPSAAANGMPAKGGGGADIDLRKIFRVWPISILGGLLGVLVAWGVLRYAVPIYQASMQLSLKEDIAASAAMPSATFNVRDPFNDKIDMMTSPSVSWKVVEKLGLQYGAISKGQLKDKDLYGVLKWQVLNESANTRPFTFIIHPQQGNKFTWIRDGQTGQAFWGMPFLMFGDSVLVNANSRFSLNSEIICYRYDLWTLARRTAARLAISPQSKSSTVMVSLVDEVPARAVDILNQLAAAYDLTTIETKNQSLSQSIRFIQDRLDPLARELDSIENAIVGFRSSNKFFGRTESTTEYLAKTSKLDGELSEIDFQFELLALLQRYINDPDTRDENLSLVGLSDTYLQGLVAEFQRLRRERDKVRQAATDVNPKRKVVEDEFNNAKNNINVQINNYRTVLNLRKGNAEQRLGEINAQLLNAPVNERQLLSMERQRKIKQDLYLLLLERKEEASITLASTTSQTSVLSPPSSGGPISPKSAQMYGIGLGLGLLLPLAFAFVRQLMDHSVSSKKQLQALTSAPVLGQVDLAPTDGKQVMVIEQGDRSAVAEQIRSIRANLSFYAASKGGPQFIMITSSFSGEGKTFISANLAKTFALQGLRVALIEFDMRKPKLARNLGISPKTGLSATLLGHGSFSEILIPDKTSPELHLYPTGVIPPNPSELMAGSKMQDFKNYLDANYDIVIMDTPPMGLVSDAQLLTPWSDVTLLVVRYGFTPKEQLAEVEEWYRNGVLGKMAIVFNGVKTRGYSGYRYSPYYYKHRYGNDYYVEKSKPKKLAGLFGRKK